VGTLVPKSRSSFLAGLSTASFSPAQGAAPLLLIIHAPRDFASYLLVCATLITASLSVFARCFPVEGEVTLLSRTLSQAVDTRSLADLPFT
jgi:hypothetical protein